ncbi:hypothetical protein QFZ25_003210 [Bacillus atrophaeus]|nr:hypothetical protein [Bacillus atrophaeus]MDQ0929150.1 hypothetical protein [Bacillus atrophaeus]
MKQKQKSVMVLTLGFEHVSAMDAEVILVPLLQIVTFSIRTSDISISDRHSDVRDCNLLGVIYDEHSPWIAR